MTDKERHLLILVACHVVMGDAPTIEQADKLDKLMEEVLRDADAKRAADSPTLEHGA